MSKPSQLIFSLHKLLNFGLVTISRHHNYYNNPFSFSFLLTRRETLTCFSVCQTSPSLLICFPKPVSGQKVQNWKSPSKWNGISLFSFATAPPSPPTSTSAAAAAPIFVHIFSTSKLSLLSFFLSFFVFASNWSHYNFTQLFLYFFQYSLLST